MTDLGAISGHISVNVVSREGEGNGRTEIWHGEKNWCGWVLGSILFWDQLHSTLPTVQLSTPCSDSLSKCNPLFKLVSRGFPLFEIKWVLRHVITDLGCWKRAGRKTVIGRSHQLLFQRTLEHQRVEAAGALEFQMFLFWFWFWMVLFLLARVAKT